MMEGIFLNGSYIPWPSPYMTMKEYEDARKKIGMKWGPEEHEQQEAGAEESGE